MNHLQGGDCHTKDMLALAVYMCAPVCPGNVLTFHTPSAYAVCAPCCPPGCLQVRLVLELCDFGNLKEFLSRGGFKLPDARLDMAAIVATALDIARAMLHLHTENIIHSDLKVGAVAG